MLKTAAGDIIGTTPTVRFLRIRQVVERTGLPPSTVYALMASGSFPRSIALGPRIRAWLEREVEDWQAARITERDLQEIA